MLKAGQHVITDPATTFRAFYSLGERQVQIKTQPAYTIEGVPGKCNPYRLEIVSNETHFSFQWFLTSISVTGSPIL